MFAMLSNAIRADVHRQLDWARAEVKRQAGHVELTIILIGVASLAGLGAVVIGLIALYVWLATQTTQFVALAAIGGGLLLLALILLGLARTRRRPQFSSPPALQLAQPAALLGISAKSRNGQRLVGGEQVASLVTGVLRNGSRSTLFGTLVIVVLSGVIIGRRALKSRD